jgi:RNA polymerase sigma-70 factor (ECF subfamily)
VGRSHARRHELPWDDLTDSEKEHAQFSLAGQSSSNAQESNELVHQLLARLSPEERQVITLLHLEERSTREISQLTGWPVSTVKVKAFRTRRKMQKLWQGLKRAENDANRPSKMSAFSSHQL